VCNLSEISVADRWRCLDSADYRGEWTVVISQVHGFYLDRMAEPAGWVDEAAAASTALLVLRVLRPKAVEAEVAAGCS
jgi:hypothetical protein